MIEITCNDRLGKKVRVKCNADDTVGDLKKLIAAQTGTKWERIVLKKWYTIFKVGLHISYCIIVLLVNIKNVNNQHGNWQVVTGGKL